MAVGPGAVAGTVLAITFLTTLLAAGGCGGGGGEPEAAAAPPAQAPETPAAPEAARPAPQQGLLARIETTQGAIVVRLFEDEVPNTVANFVHLASKGFYDGLIFHRVISGFMIQGGCPLGTGMGGPGWRIADEFAPTLKHSKPGILSMANAGPNTGGSQFFITLEPTPFLDGRHAVFGEVVEGMSVVRAIGALKTDRSDRPLEPPKIERIILTRDGKRLEGVQPKPKTLGG